MARLCLASQCLVSAVLVVCPEEEKFLNLPCILIKCQKSLEVLLLLYCINDNVHLFMYHIYHYTQTFDAHINIFKHF